MNSKAIIEQATRLANHDGDQGVRYARAFLAAFPATIAVIEINRTKRSR